MSHTVHVFDYLVQPAEYAPAGICVAFGDEPFLKRLAIDQLQKVVIGEEDTPFATFDGETVEWRDVMDELATVSLFGGGRPRLAIVENGDSFVKTHRSRLEDYVEKPKRNSVLILDVGVWAANTRLYKAVDKTGLQIECRAPQKTVRGRKYRDENRLAKWIAEWGTTQHQVKLPRAAVELLLELQGDEFGLLDQELAKLALFADDKGSVTADTVRDVVGGWKTKTVWELADAACDGNAAEALLQLDRLLQSGDNPLALYGQIAWSLRRFAAATRIYQQAERSGRRMPLRQALTEAGFRNVPSLIARAEKQLMQLGRERAGQIYQWLLETDLALKGSHSTPHRARFMLEQLILRMAKEVAPRRRR